MTDQRFKVVGTSMNLSATRMLRIVTLAAVDSGFAIGDASAVAKRAVELMIEESVVLTKQ